MCMDVSKLLRTWRQKKPRLLCPVMKQKKSTCYAIAYVRQLEFHLKEHLSIQDFLNQILKSYLLEDGSLNVDSSFVLLPGLRFKAKEITQHKLYFEGCLESQDEYDKFHAILLQKLKKGVLSEIYFPTKNEMAGNTERYGHVMVCTGHNYDRLNRLYYELQEVAGVKVCDQGFVRVYADLVYQFIEMVV
ncbi:unnamed protein product [Eruca vesicaria subsp. sativa]|uniref:Uncharacterized protein n=1 Tax=Eruca vesicaria subsp. sativa TaxID=29727 RepID=A0ABC8LFM5_ERUVS|nr:unnamed protein product [Eruca vesicaria subsp. sativa]